MSISGTLETFSLPEIFRLLDSGSKYGRLIFQSLPDPLYCEPRLYYLWFEKGRLVAISDRLNRQSLIHLIESRGWLDRETVTKIDRSCLNNQSLGFYLKKNKLLTPAQLETIFELHLNWVYQLFEISAAWFQFDEISEQSEIEGLQTMPWLEMTGENIRAAEVVLIALRSQKNWDIFAEQLPEPEYALKKLVPRSQWQLLPIESQIWELANGRVSLQSIANKIGEPLIHVQQAAFCLIMAGLADEIPITNFINLMASPPQPQTDTQSQLTSQKPRVSFSLLKNLVNFLRQKLW